MSANPANNPQQANDLPRSLGEQNTIQLRGPASDDPKVLIVNPRNCTGCRTCEVTCSFVHASAGRFGRSRIRVHPVGGERSVQITCLQCSAAACMNVCPTQALARNPNTGAIEVLSDRCIGCALCEAACPFGHMHFDPTLHLAVKCDLCGGNPACASFCPHKALEWR